MKEIRIKLYSPRDLWMKYLDRLEHEADTKTEKNIIAVENFKNKILHHIAREPIPKENKEYLREMVNVEFSRVGLYPVWPKIEK